MLGTPMIRRCSGELEAHRTETAFERTFTGMDADVIAQTVSTEKRLRAEFALMRTVLLMDAHVFVEDKLTRKVPAARRARERVLFVVRWHVLLQIAGTDEGSRA